METDLSIYLAVRRRFEAARRPAAPRKRARRGFTLIELLLAMTIMGLLASMAVIPFRKTLDRARTVRAISEISMLQREIAAYDASNGEPPPSLADIGRGGMLDPWGRPYEYLRFQSKGGGGGGGGGGGIAGQARKDRFLVPINSTYDLYSVGADGKSTGPLTASISRDDIIRAADGGYIGLASGY